MKKNIILFVFALALVPARMFAQVAVIANKNVPYDSLNKVQLRDFYSCEMKQWDKRTPVAVVDLKLATAAKEAFYKFLGMTASRMKSLWLKKVLLGESGEPIAVQSEEEMLHRVATTSGALGFVSLEKATAEVKILLVIAPNEKVP